MKVSALFLLMLCLAFPALAQSPDWPAWRGPEGTGVSSESNWNPLALKDGARILWTADVGAGYSNVAIKDGRLYITGRDRKTYKFILSCLDAGTGKVIWTFDKLRIFGDAMSTPATDGVFVYCLGKDATIFCLRASDGSLVWKKDLLDDFHLMQPSFGWAGSPVIEGDRVILNAGRAGLALEKSTGKLAWSNGDGRGVGYYASPVLSGAGESRIALFFSGETLNAVRAVDGKPVWSVIHGETDDVVADPIPVGDGVFFSQHDYGMLVRIEGGQVGPAWKSEGLRSGITTPVLVDGRLFGTDWSEYVGADNWSHMSRVIWPFRCIDAETGATKWETMMKSVAPSAAYGRLLLLEIDGTLHIAEASADAYQEYSKADVLNGLKKPRLFTTPPVLLDGRIYCRNYSGDLICIDVRS